MQIALYQGKSLISKAIRWQTRGVYSHAAIILPDTTIVEAWHNPAKVRLITTLSDGHTPGTTVDIFDVATSEQQRDDISVFARMQMGKPYDFAAIARFMSRRNKDNPDKWFCSELVFSAFRYAGIDLLERTEPFQVSPVLLSRSPLLVKSHSITTTKHD